MPSCWEEALSALYIGMTGNYRLTYEDRAMEAEDQLEKLLQQLQKREDALHVSKEKCRQEALAVRRDKNRCRAKVMEHKRMGAQLERLVQYREMVLQHMDALRSTELNKSLISTLQESSKTLKAMGVIDGVKLAETVVQDVETSMAHVRDLTSVLGTPMAGEPSLLEDDLEQELEMLEVREEVIRGEVPTSVHTMEREEVKVPHPALS